jgi:hypothetical protein
LQAIRCPAGLYFDIEKQTCDWKSAVKNCKLKSKERKVKPLLITDEPLCQEGFLACGDGSCVERGLFCNGEKVKNNFLNINDALNQQQFNTELFPLLFLLLTLLRLHSDS